MYVDDHIHDCINWMMQIYQQHNLVSWPKPMIITSPILRILQIITAMARKSISAPMLVPMIKIVSNVRPLEPFDGVVAVESNVSSTCIKNNCKCNWTGGTNITSHRPACRLWTLAQMPQTIKVPKSWTQNDSLQVFRIKFLPVRLCTDTKNKLFTLYTGKWPFQAAQPCGRLNSRLSRPPYFIIPRPSETCPTSTDKISGEL